MPFDPLAVAAVDFGTHGTGFAWAPVDARNARVEDRVVNFCNRWAAMPVATAKNLTALLLDENGDVAAWGYDARKRSLTMRTEQLAKHRYMTAFKMALDGDPLIATGDEDGTPASTHPDVAATGEKWIPAFSAISAYLQCIREQAVDQITASGYGEDVIRWCLTIPGSWSDFQKQVMREAAKAAGFPTEEGRLLLAYEPEAAAHHARVSGTRVERRGRGAKAATLMTPGVRFLVVDCGGGTVDTTAYENDADGLMVELARAEGAKLGSNYINEAFLDLLAKRLGGHEVVTQLRRQHPGAYLELLDSWERTKLNITFKHDDTEYINLPAAVDRFIDDATRTRLARLQDDVTDAIAVSPEESRTLFETVVPGILKLVDEQLDVMQKTADKKAQQPVVLLVGGFGTSPYLQASVQEHVSGRAQFLVAPDPNVAVLFGAVHFCYEPHTRARRAKLTYGIRSAQPFEEGIDPEDSKFQDEDNRDMCEGRFSRFVRTGEVVPTDKEVAHTYHPLFASQDVLRICLYTSDHPEPRYTSDEGCAKVGEITVSLAKVMRFAMEERGVKVFMKFGETEVKVRAVVERSGEETSTEIRFHSNL
ncbi:Hsp70 family protein [Streptomyces sp. NPDC048208]|uniref:Hsp70 family protein n=1 Tax=Streptomyces sp. NPDC048208 TaxID=3365515 RepID=UPI003710A78A